LGARKLTAEQLATTLSCPFCDEVLDLARPANPYDVFIGGWRTNALLVHLKRMHKINDIGPTLLANLLNEGNEVMVEFVVAHEMRKAFGETK